MLVARSSARDGRLDILVNAAGGVRGQVGRPIEEISEDDWRVDLRGQCRWRVLARAGGRSRR